MDYGKTISNVNIDIRATASTIHLPHRSEGGKTIMKKVYLEACSKIVSPRNGRI